MMRSLALCSLLLALACGPKQDQKQTARGASVPSTQADVYTFSTTTRPDGKQWVSAVVVANGKARLTDELDRWRLFDLEANSVTFVDDVKKTFTTESLQSLVRRRSSEERKRMPSGYPPMVLARGDVQQISGKAAAQYVVQMGGFRRELWISSEPFIHERLFPLIMLSEPIGGPNPAAQAALHRSLAGMRGFPLLEKTTVSYGKKEMTIERKLARVDRKAVPLSLVAIASDYKDLTPVTEPAAGRRSSSSPPSGRSTRATE